MTNLVPFTLFTFNRMEISPPPPAAFEEIIGYSGDLRFVGFYYQGSSVCIEDGMVKEVGDRSPWSIWYRSLGVEIHKHFCFGYDGRDPEHMLILDRKARTLYAGPVQAARDALRQQVPCLQETQSEAPLQADLDEKEEDLTYLLANTMSTADCERRQAKKKEGMEMLETWLRRQG